MWSRRTKCSSSLVTHSYRRRLHWVPTIILPNNTGSKEGNLVGFPLRGFALGQCLVRVNGMFAIPLTGSHWLG